MRLRFRPVDSAFYDLFAESAHHLVVGAGLLAEMLGESADREDVAQRMRAAEHEADETTHAIVRRVRTAFVTPFDREDVHRLAAALDDVMDRMDEVVDLLLLHDPPSLPADLSQQVAVLQRCAELTAAAMPRLPSLASLEEYWIEINRLENTGARTHRRILAALHSGEYRALEVLRLRDVVDALEAAIKGFETVALTIEQIAVKES
ncbi:DUF47 domain-containing protein [Nocardioides sp.]|uniref:DUF47 domain-containing protein n=1 Tax=Nocardioides sp. TaxID=35761 RepID=UPI003516CB16